jgi:TRAP-type mannitol/chloroaromatic compound transport system permease large subunit
MDIIPVVAIISNVLMVVLIVYFVTRARQRRAELQIEMQSRMIDRFSTASELVQFLQSEAGRQFMSGVQAVSTHVTRDRLMRGFNRSIVLIMLAIGFVFIGFYTREEDAHVAAAILGSLGVGFLIATFVSYKLSEKLMSETVREP